VFRLFFFFFVRKSLGGEGEKGRIKTMSTINWDYFFQTLLLPYPIEVMENLALKKIKGKETERKKIKKDIEISDYW